MTLSETQRWTRPRRHRTKGREGRGPAPRASSSGACGIASAPALSCVFSRLSVPHSLQVLCPCASSRRPPQRGQSPGLRCPAAVLVSRHPSRGDTVLVAQRCILVSTVPSTGRPELKRQSGELGKRSQGEEASLALGSRRGTEVPAPPEPSSPSSGYPAKVTCPREVPAESRQAHPSRWLLSPSAPHLLASPAERVLAWPRRQGGQRRGRGQESKGSLGLTKGQAPSLLGYQDTSSARSLSARVYVAPL